MNYNQFITEEVLGEVWQPAHSYWWCPKCEVFVRGHQVTYEECHEKCGYKVIEKDVNRDFSTPADWWYLWEFSKKQEWWPNFWTQLTGLYLWFEWESLSLVERVKAIAKFHGWKE